MSTFLYPYKQGSESAKALAKALEIRQLKVEGSKFRGDEKKTVINWGSSNIENEEVLKARVLNHPEKVGIVSNKLTFFKEMKKIGLSGIIPAWSEYKDTVQDWLDGGYTVFARTKLNAHSGAGIVVINPGDDIPNAPLYTRYIKKKSEWRVHFMNKELFFVQQKVRRTDHPDDQVNWLVRNHENGFNYAWQDVNPPERVMSFAKSVAIKLGLDFGAIDIIYNQGKDEAYVLEVNSAPGLTGETINQYADAFNRHYLNPEAKVETEAWGDLPPIRKKLLGKVDVVIHDEPAAPVHEPRIEEYIGVNGWGNKFMRDCNAWDVANGRPKRYAWMPG